METNNVPYRSSKRRKLSQADMRQITQKPVPKPEDIFLSTPDKNETTEARKMCERLERQAVEEAKLREQVLNHKFIQGRKYLISSRVSKKGKYEPKCDEPDDLFIYQSK